MDEQGIPAPAGAAQGLSIATTANLLRRYQFVGRTLVRALAAWFLAAPSYELKYRLADHLWAHAEHVTWLRERLSEMRGGHPDADVAPALRRLSAELVEASNADEFVAGYGEVVAAWRRALIEYCAVADRAANAREIAILSRIKADLDAQLAWIEALLGTDRGRLEPWVQHLRSLLQAAGGVSGFEKPAATGTVGPTGGSRFELPTRLVIDERIRLGPLTSQASRDESPAAEHRKLQFEVYFNEIYAASLLASILYDAWDTDAPWEFFADLARQLWDEARHSEFGNIRLRELGFEPTTVNPILFEQVLPLSFLHRYCYLTLDLEVHFMARKRPRVRRFEAENDTRSALFADADWSDEISHVGYGKKWIAYFLKDDFRTPDDLKAEVRAFIEQNAAVANPPF